ncbi:MAG: tRNA dihydrouridine(20/20a) synthase DusA [Pseudomonadota bacterium]
MKMDVSRQARLSCAPMMDWTDRHCRAFHRVLSTSTLLYTEMITAPALVRGGARHLLEFDPSEHPVAVQLGGSDPAELASAAKMAEDEGFAEVNLNVGCPSDRVKSGCFGAILMERPELVAECVASMIDAVSVPVTVKCRLGVDDQVVEQTLPHFLGLIEAAGVRRVTVHARKAWLQGLSPKENRDVPPLDYGLVHRMKAAFPGIHMSINGGIASLDTALEQLNTMDGVMIGRAAYHTPYEILAPADRLIFGEDRDPVGRDEAALRMRPYLARHLERGGRLHQVTRHMLGLFAGQPGARAWRRLLSEGAAKPDAGLEVFDAALASVSPALAGAAE